MNANLYYTRTWVLRRYSRGPIASHLTRFSEFLKKQGYPYATGQRYVREVGHLSRWLDQRRIGIEDLNEKIVNIYWLSRKKGRCSHLTKGPYRQLLKYLRQNSIIKTSVAEKTMIDECIGQYQEHMAKNQGLAEETIRGRIRQRSTFPYSPVWQ